MAVIFLFSFNDTFNSPEEVTRSEQFIYSCRYIKEKCKKRGYGEELVTRLDFGNGTIKDIRKHKGVSIKNIVQEFTVGFSSFGVNCTVTFTTDNNKKVSLSNECLIDVKRKAPTAKITPGPKKILAAGMTIKASGHLSRNNDYPDGYRGLNFEWYCFLIRDGNSIPCNITDTTNLQLTVDDITKRDDVFNINLFVRYTDFKTSIDTLEVIVVDNGTIFELNCLKNCEPVSEVTLREVRTVLKAKCLNECDAIGPGFFEWSVSINKGKTEIIKDDDERFNININEHAVTIETDKFQTGDEIAITLTQATNRVKSVYKVVTVTKTPSLEGACVVVPKQGYSMKTTFHVKCNKEQLADLTYDVSAASHNGTLVHLNRGSSLESTGFQLAVDSTVYLRITKKNGLSGEFKIGNVKIKSKESQDTMENMNKTLQHIQDGIDVHDNYKALSKLNGLHQQINQAGSDEDKKLVNMAILEKLEQIDPENTEQLREIVQIAADMYGNMNDPDLADETSKVCKKMAELFLKRDTEEKDNKAAITAINDCSQTALHEDTKFLNTTPKASVTKDPDVNYDSTEENYPDYENDDDLDEARQKFYDTLLNSEETCYLNGDKIIKDLVIGESQSFIQLKDVNIATKRERGIFFCNITVNAKIVQLIPSCDFKKTMEPQTATVRHPHVM